MECEHTTNYYVEEDAPIILCGGFVDFVTYRCLKCKELIYKEHIWDSKWKLYKDYHKRPETEGERVLRVAMAGGNL